MPTWLFILFLCFSHKTCHFLSWYHRNDRMEFEHLRFGSRSLSKSGSQMLLNLNFFVNYKLTQLQFVTHRCVVCSLFRRNRSDVSLTLIWQDGCYFSSNFNIVINHKEETAASPTDLLQRRKASHVVHLLTENDTKCLCWD